MYKVLLVDDEPVVTKGLSQYFPWEDEGFSVSASVSSAARALMVMEEGDIDLVITDVNMPIQNGLDLIKIIKSEYPKVKTVILSGYSEFSYAQSALRLGALDYLTKPIDFNQMKEVLRKVKSLLDEQNSSADDTIKEILLLNYINGTVYRDEDNLLEELSSLTIAKVLSDNIEDIDQIQNKIKSAFSSSIILKDESNTFYAIFINSDLNEDEIRLKISKDTKMYSSFYAGISSGGKSYTELKQLALQATKAMKYQYAQGQTGISSYKQVKNLYQDLEGKHDAIIKEITEMLTTAQRRDEIQKYFTSLLITLWNNVPYLKCFASELIVEVNLFLKNYLSANSERIPLSNILLDIMDAKTLEDINDTVSTYFSEAISILKEKDEALANAALADRIKAYIDLHYAENISLISISDHFSITPVYLSRVFKKKVGTNYIDYLTKIRMEKAKEYLDNSSLKVYEIPPLIGYDNQRYFNKVFKESFGLSPKEYRENKA